MLCLASARSGIVNLRKPFLTFVTPSVGKQAPMSFVPIGRPRLLNFLVAGLFRDLAPAERRSHIPDNRSAIFLVKS